MPISNEVQVALAFCSGAALASVAAVACSRLQPWTWWWKARVEAAATLAAVPAAEPPLGLQEALKDDILTEHFTRNIQFFGKEGQQAIFDSTVAVVGLGVRSRTL